MTTQVVSPAGNCQPAEIVRPVANFSPSLWGDRFSSFVVDNEVIEKYAKEIELLKGDIKVMLTAECNAWQEKMNLIDALERLGVSYHFEKEIEEQIEGIFTTYENARDREECDLHTVALYFRLFRQHGYKISCDVFYKFMDLDGKFKETLTSDVKGMLSLYEAAYLKVHGEHVLEEALVFTTKTLRDLGGNNNVSHALEKQVAHALEQSLRRGMPRLEASLYVSIYQDDELSDESVLRLAKLDFNKLQILHKQELYELSRWWKDLNLISELPYARDRIVECYFWSLGVYFEPQYSQARIMLAKIIAMISVIDDTYDSYGTIDELEIFTNAVERWDMSCINQLPNYMKVCYRALLQLYNEYDVELTKEGRSFAVSYAINTMKDIVRCYNIEAKWFIEGYIPTFDDYLRNGSITSTYYLLTTASFLGMKEITTPEAYDWLLKNPKMLEGSVTICRLIDDVATYEIEKGRGQLATGVECYMKQHGVSKEEAMDEFLRKCEDAWTDMNQECLKQPAAVSKNIFMRIFNLARMIDVAYKHFEDGYTNPGKVFKKHVIALLVDHFQV